MYCMLEGKQIVRPSSRLLLWQQCFVYACVRVRVRGRSNPAEVFNMQWKAHGGLTTYVRLARRGICARVWCVSLNLTADSWHFKCKRTKKEQKKKRTKKKRTKKRTKKICKKVCTKNQLCKVNKWMHNR